MSDSGRDGIAMQEYRRALLQNAQDLVVAEAERAVCVEWAMELARRREQAEIGCAAAKLVWRAAQAAVAARQRAGDIKGLVQAHSRLEAAQAEVRSGFAARREVVAAVEDALVRMTRAQEERGAVLSANQRRIRSTWYDALGELLGEPTESAPGAGVASEAE
jgi:hypothetical protein